MKIPVIQKNTSMAYYMGIPIMLRVATNKADGVIHKDLSIK